MSETTKKALANSLIKLCEEKKLSKITVNDIVLDCGVNRNTFYYHFIDIYDVLDYIFTQEETNIRKRIRSIDTWQEDILDALSDVKSYKYLIMNVYDSLNREQLEQYLYHVVSTIIKQYIDVTIPNLSLDNEKIFCIIDFYTCANVGIMLKWIGSGMKGDVKVLGNRIKNMTQGLIEKSVENLSI